jgi:hypothetical protein
MPETTAYLDTLDSEQRRAVEHGITELSAGVPQPPAAFFGRLDQFLDLSRRQILAGAHLGVGHPPECLLRFSLHGSTSFRCAIIDDSLHSGDPLAG